MTYADGSTDVVASDRAFTSSPGPVRYADLMIGERYDARLEQTGWSRPGFDDSAWTSVDEVEHPLTNLVAHYGEPLRVIAEIPAVDVFTTPKGETIVDFGPPR